MIGHSRMKTILITGINGYLGSSLAFFLRGGYKVIGLEYSLQNLYRLAGGDFKVYSVEDGIPAGLFEEQRIDIIIHTATLYGRLNEGVKTIADANLSSPFALLDMAIERGCPRFINTDTVLDRFVSPYALSKRHFQEWLYLRRKEIKIANMRLEHLYGPGAPDTNFITAMVKRLKQNDPVIDLTEGEQERDFVFIDDVLSAYKTILDHYEQLPDSYNEYRVSSGEQISIKRLMIMLKEMTRSDSRLNFGAIPYRENELMRSETRRSGLTDLGWKPGTSIREGLLKTI